LFHNRRMSLVGKKPISSATVLYNWEPTPGSSIQGITIAKDQTITIYQKFDNGWWVGQIDSTGVAGIFPGSYVKETQVFPQTTTASAPNTLAPAQGFAERATINLRRGNSGLTTVTTEAPADTRERCIAIKSYKGTSPQLSFEEGDEIIVLERWQTGWCRGICNGKTGLFAK